MATLPALIEWLSAQAGDTDESGGILIIVGAILGAALAVLALVFLVTRLSRRNRREAGRQEEQPPGRVGRS